MESFLGRASVGTHRTELLQTGIKLVERGVLLGCFPEISIRSQLADGTLRVLSRAPRVRPFDLSVFVRKRTVPSPAVEALITAMREVLSERPRDC